MTEPAKAKPKRKFKWKLSLLSLLLLSGVAGLVGWLNSDNFREMVRARVVAELEHMTGGRVELDSFSWKLRQLRFEARGLAIHGLEPPGEEPYIRADRISLNLKIISLLTRKVSLEGVVIDRPTVHLIVNAQGIVNQPAPKGDGEGSLSTQRLFDLAVKRVQINGGAIVINQERMPFDLQGDQLSAGLSYSADEGGYDGNLALAVDSLHWRESAGLKGIIEARFILRTTEAEIKSLKLSSGRSAVEASGKIRNYSHPEIQMKYGASLDLSEFGRLARLSQLQGGIAEIRGDLNWQAGRYSSQGSMTARGLSWRESTWRVSGAEFTSAFAVTAQKLTLSRMTGRAFRGSLQGELQVENWNRPSGDSKSPLERGSANLRFSGMEIRDLATAVSTQRMPIDKIEMVGIASGEMRASWTGALQNAVAEFSMDVTPPGNPSPRQVPVTARLQATYLARVRTLHVANLNVATRALRATLSGDLGSRTAQAKVAVTATDLHELQPALDALRPGTRVPVAVSGRASFIGSVFGDLDALSAVGRLELENFTTTIAFAVDGHASGEGPTNIHWSSLGADLAYSPAELSLQHGLLRRGKTQIGFSLNAGLHRGEFDENLSQLKLDLRAENAPLEDLQALTELNYPVTGNVNADLHVSGSLRSLRGNGNLQIQKLTAYGENFLSFRSQLKIAGQEVQLNNLVAVHNGAQLTGMLAVDVPTRAARFDLTGANFDLATMHDLQSSRFSIGGKAEFHVSGSLPGTFVKTGTPAGAAIDGKLTIANLIVNKEAVGNFSATAETRGDDLAVRGRSVFEDATLDFGGSVQLRGDFPARITAQFAHLDIDPVLRAYLQAQLTGHSSIEGTLEIAGPMRRPRDLTIKGTVNRILLNVESIQVQNDGPVVFSMNREIFRAGPFHLQGQDTELFMNGGIGVAGDHSLDLHTRGRLNLKLAQRFNPNVVAYGPVSFSVDVGGSVAHPQMNGRMELADAGVSLADLPNGLSHINGTMIFAQDRVQIEKLTALSGGGELNVGGFLAYRNGIYFDLTATGREVRLRYPPGISSSGDANLRYTGSANSSLLSGDITITRFIMNPRFDFAVFLAQTNKAPVLSTMNPFLENLRLDVHIASAQELQVETSLARLSGDVDLHVRGTAARPAVLGRVTMTEGQVSFNGTRFRLERGDISFSNPLVMEPVVNVEMSARVQNYDITVGLHGTLSGGRGLNLTYRSDPPLSNSDIIALLAFGRTQGQDVYNASQPGQNPNDVSTASNAVLGEALNAAVSDRVERIFGGSRVRVDPQFIGAENNPSARVTIEQTIKNNLTLTYITNVTQSAQTVIQFEYNINKDLSIIGVRDENGVVSFNVSIRQRRK
jgi:translocation and assembly module TamB